MTDLSLLTVYSHKATIDDHGKRIDAVLATHIDNLTRARIQDLLRQGHVRIDDVVAQKLSEKVKDGTTLTVHVPPPIDAIPKANAIPFDIVYEDDHLLVLNKPAGMVVHPAPGHYDDTLVNALLAHCGDKLSGIGGVKRPGIVHRLDQGTSGLMVVAKNDAAHQGLSQQFTHHTLARTYVAYVWGLVKVGRGTVEGNIGRHPQNRKKMSIVSHGGKPARTHFKLEHYYAPFVSKIICNLETGRTHQIRVHMTSLGHPLLGDPLYGRPKQLLPNVVKDILKSETWEAAKRQALHAFKLAFIHPTTKELMSFEIPLPDDLKQLEEALGASVKP